MLTALVGLWALTIVWASQGYDLNDQWNRMAWGWTGLAGVLVLAFLTRGDYAKAALLGWVGWTCMITTPLIGKMPRSVAWMKTGSLCVALAGGSLLWPSGVDRVMILGGLALVGVGVTGWAWYSCRHATGQYQAHWGPFLLCDESNVCPRAGQGNANHAQAVIVLSLAAALGLSLVHSPLWLGVVPVQLFGIWLCRDHRGHWLTQGVVQAGVLLVGAGLWGGLR